MIMMPVKYMAKSKSVTFITQIFISMIRIRAILRRLKARELCVWKAHMISPLCYLITSRWTLKDGDRDFCKGFLNWSDALAEKIWLDSHICSVIKGQHGYAAIHYMIYSAAVQATVKLYLTSSNRFNRFGSVSGKIAAEHSTHDYGTYFDKEYYRSIVFSRTPESPTLLPEEEESIPVPPEYVESGISSSDVGSKSPKLFKGTGIRLPLSKSIVCVSDDACLIFDLNLSAKVEMQGSQHQELAFSGRPECEIGRRMCVVFQKGDSQMCLLVDWRNF